MKIDKNKHVQERVCLLESVINDGIWEWELEQNRFSYSSRWREIMGYQPEVSADDIGAWINRVHKEDLPTVLEMIDKCRTGTTTVVGTEHRIMHEAGYFLWVYSRVRGVLDDEGKVCQILGSLTNISDYKIAHGQLVHGAFKDKLTGLPNRAMLMELLNKTIRSFSEDSSEQFALLFFDVDRFKYINDSLGHEAGDQFLKKIAKRLQVYEGPDDLLVRIGGDEFVLLMRKIDDTMRVKNIAEGLLKIVSLPILMFSRKLYASASIGIYIAKQKELSAGEIIKNAETAMYKAKSKGKARYEQFESAMSEDALKMLTVDHELRRALDEEEFCLHYQPVVAVKDSRIVGFEALIRWQHPQRGLLTPKDFIEIAEETGIIVAIGDWVLNEAAEQYMRWNKQGFDHLHVAVNFSTSQFEQKKLLATIVRIMKTSGMPANKLYFEVTESAAMGDLHINRKLLDTLSEMGISILIDDFGTGYSSLSYLKKLPFNILKIDKSFVDEVPMNPDSVAIIDAIIAMAHKLKLKIVAEGVENRKQYDFLKKAGCDFIQGYYFYRPLSEEDATNLLKSLKKGKLK